MNLTLRFLDGTETTVESVQGLRIVGPCELETNTFGNAPVRQRDVLRYSAEFDFARDFDFKTGAPR